MFDELYERRTWEAPVPLDIQLSEIMDTVAVLHMLPDSGLDTWGDSEYDTGSLTFDMMRYVFMHNSDRIRRLVYDDHETTYGEWAFVLSRFPRIFESVIDDEEKEKALFFELFLSNARQSCEPYTAAAWALLWLHKGSLNNAGLPSQIARYGTLGLSFDDVAPWILAGVEDPDIIAKNVAGGVDISLYDSLTGVG